ncbi:hypothetical protein WKI13_14085 [Teredinibacter turnerae]|uniref:hypothetical protein n=1 Tax=Teredinibacter turnerae TaxID=2426 RepID=UPI00036921EF|nr:hypothetical protein [Teredinibacter turnerae]
MNFFTLDRDPTIKQLLISLDTELSGIDSCVDADFATDSKAIFLRHRDNAGMCAYIYTVGQRDNRYGVQLEFPPENGPVLAMETYENIGYNALKDILMVHLDLAEAGVPPN